MSDETNVADSSVTATDAATDATSATQTATNTTQATKTKTDEQTASADAKVQTGAPEKYDLKPPEGLTFAPEALAAFEKEARALKMTQADAQEYLNARFESIKTEREASEKAQADAFKATNEGWINELKADPDFGGANFEKSQSRINAVRERYGNDATKDLFDQIGNHPGLCKMLAKIGADMEQDHFVKGNTPATQDSGLKSFYSNSPELK